MVSASQMVALAVGHHPMVATALMTTIGVLHHPIALLGALLEEASAARLAGIESKKVHQTWAALVLQASEEWTQIHLVTEVGVVASTVSAKPQVDMVASRALAKPQVDVVVNKALAMASEVDLEQDPHMALAVRMR